MNELEQKKELNSKIYYKYALITRKYKGKLTLRVPSELNKALIIKALEQSISKPIHCIKTLINLIS